MLSVWIWNSRRGASPRRCATPAAARCASAASSAIDFARSTSFGATSRKDLDIEVFGIPQDALLPLLKSLGRVEPVGQAFPVYKLGAIDVALPRRESKTGRGHKGFTVEGDPSMSFDEAARRRDFTINAIGWDPLTDEYLDPFHGRQRSRAPCPPGRRSGNVRGRLPPCPPCPAVCGAVRADDRSGDRAHLLRRSRSTICRPSASGASSRNCCCRPSGRRSASRSRASSA